MLRVFPKANMTGSGLVVSVRLNTLQVLKEKCKHIFLDLDMWAHEGLAVEDLVEAFTNLSE